MSSKFLGIFIISLIFSSKVFSGSPDIRVFPSGNLQVETFLATHPTNPMIMAGTAITDVYPGGYTTGAYITTDGGNSWNGTNSIKTAQNNIISTVGDPTIVIDKDGVMIIPFIGPPTTQGGKDYRIGVSRSTNNGINWSSTIFVPDVDSADKIMSSTDDIPSSPYYGRSYIVYSEKTGIHFSFTTNNGQTWSPAARVSPQPDNRRAGACIVTGTYGEIFITWPYTYQSSKFIGFAKSTDGGVTWSASDHAIPVCPSPNDFRFNLNLVKLNGLPILAIDKSNGPNQGKLYVVCNQGLDALSPALDNYDIIMYSSDNSGLSWSTPSLVHQSTSGITRHQFYPNINIDKGGGVNIVYYDNRNTPTNDSSEVFISRSTNGGNTFEDILLSDHKFKMSQLSSSERLFGNPPYVGSYIGISSSGSKVHALWFDNSSGKYQAWNSYIETAPEVNITLIPQGLYNSFSNLLNRKDSVKVFLRSASTPYLIIDSSFSDLDSVNYSGIFNFSNVITGQYFISVIHKNSITTWSSVPVNYNSSSGMNYNFTDQQSKAFGNNMMLIDSNPVSYGIYSGDVNRDGAVDLPDLMQVEIDLENFMTGNLITDINGDNLVDNSDYTIVENNSFNFVYTMTP
ncbi:MAG TPA: hypothetical protein PK294_14445 [Ignavibacteria bacterium]|nr:hypothetical protein [Ignavibacteria bacterium]